MESTQVQQAIGLAFRLADRAAEAAMIKFANDPRSAARAILAAYRRAERVRDELYRLEAAAE